MNSTTFFQNGAERAPSRILRAIDTFLAAWSETVADYRAYREATLLSPGQLARRRQTRNDAVRRAVGLPRLPRA
ncbi:hypothetical protein [Azospirillum halopraeferens]|uniref:hypothetical protein n=1 Tax=Azospirillum halopraeferens TaxID=34010 RepID=UPI00041576A1|nr:hypothetical protein [Azospirillum halopraeferens]